MIPFLVLLAVAYWLAAPDPVTAGARTASGSGARAAGSGARAQWAAGRKDRAVSRTKRRDRWHKAGGLRRSLLGIEHAAVVASKVAKGSGKLAGAAVRPVPAAARAGWSSGVERHRARAKDRPVPIVVDPPWWRRDTPTHLAPGQPAGQVEDTPDASPGTGPGQATGTGDPTDPLAGTSPEGQAPTTEPAPAAKCFACDEVMAGGWFVTPKGPACAHHVYFPPFPTDPPAGMIPAGVTSPTTEGDPVSVNVPSEINDLTTLHGFAQAVVEDAEENGPGSTYAQAAASLSEYFGRDFGREVNATASAFEESAAAFNQAWQAMVEAAEAMKSESLAAIGG